MDQSSTDYNHINISESFNKHDFKYNVPDFTLYDEPLRGIFSEICFSSAPRPPMIKISIIINISVKNNFYKSVYYNGYYNGRTMDYNAYCTKMFSTSSLKTCAKEI